MIPFVLPKVVKGMITVWSGAIVAIPSGWALCDGNNETPDLRDKFIVGAGDSYAPAATGGTVTHAHNFTGSGHYHDFIAGPHIAAGTNIDTQTNTGNATGVTDAGDTLPPYYALAYIMKL